MRHDEDADVMGAAADAALASRQHQAPPRRAGRLLAGHRPAARGLPPGHRQQAIAGRFQAASPLPPGPRRAAARLFSCRFPPLRHPSPTLITVARGVVV
ncbi:hypothetical protein GIY62_24965 [Burkholderia plantarii]|uniref:hypothetical protein n=1 Tax=Burkholderia plantarii TaxID=41899 RepID=UPI00272A1F35|nr:hypothetical protein [Burkholderia plantarii]WLE63537.1 hypothetical protein GIY62_24965 [Burkholderia plantarii]